MVAVAITAGVVAAATVTTPADIPSVALRAVPVYRVEVGAAVFFAFYLVAMALVLAMHNRAFTEIGTDGIRARDMATASEELDGETLAAELLEELAEEIGNLRARRQDVH
ncbi:MAG: hypothetical protein ACRDPE_16980 [Solirubrobacterales bacterium]